ncbi:MAG: zinc-ribbon domain-containing protein [Candidatus Cloacimonetes bacterium]|nr:zinc-ribbon domain-containing protein [Candidatus Cloacimonadota bacterium]
MPYCKNCGEEIDVDVQACPYCGAKIDELLEDFEDYDEDNFLDDDDDDDDEDYDDDDDDWGSYSDDDEDEN